MSGVIAWMAAEAERPEVNIPADLAGDSENTHPSTSSGQAFSQNRREVEHPPFPPNENRPSTSLRAGYGWGTQHPEQSKELWDSRENELERRIYRRRTVAMLRRYLRYSIETGRLPSLVGREYFRAKVTKYTMHTFEDRVIFVHDMEMCLERLDEFSRQVIARHILQEHDCRATARLLQCHEKTIRRLTPLALDLLSDILLEVGLMEQFEPAAGNSCQEGRREEIFVSDCEDGAV